MAVFSGCRSLKTITIPNNVTSIGMSAFYGCSSLKSVTIPNSVTSIGEKVFSNCSALTSIIVEKNNPIYDSRNNCNAIIETKSNKLISGCKKTIIPNNVTSIGNYAFYNISDLETIAIPNSVKSIGDNAFYNNPDLETITIPNSVKSIGDKAFDTCYKIKKITSKITKPFAINENTFSNRTYSNATLYVPKGTAAKYKATEGWKNFKRIVEEGTKTGIDEVEADNSLNTSKRIYDINGKRLPATSLDELPSGLYIVNGKKVVK